METWVRSWVPCGEIRGMVIRHGEAFTMCEHLTVNDENGQALYRPTVHYAYHPSDAAINSVLELRMRGWQMQERQRILNDEIVSGRDELGVLLMGHPYTAWWTGSLLSIDEARAVVDSQNATTLQVAGSIIAAVSWMLEHPERGRVRARRSAVARHPRGRRRLPRHDAQRPERLGSGVQPPRPVRRLQRRDRARSTRPTPGSSPTS